MQVTEVLRQVSIPACRSIQHNINSGYSSLNNAGRKNSTEVLSPSTLFTHRRFTVEINDRVPSMISREPVATAPPSLSYAGDDKGPHWFAAASDSQEFEAASPNQILF
eukprot:Filipodium_phascolosomae@DN2460_c0_g1_i3.p1